LVCIQVLIRGLRRAGNFETIIPSPHSQEENRKPKAGETDRDPAQILKPIRPFRGPVWNSPLYDFSRSTIDRQRQHNTPPRQGQTSGKSEER
jgi:hypothetical protein